MSNHKTTLDLLKKLGELRSESYEINWEEWENLDNSNDLLEKVDGGLQEYEEKFLLLAEDTDFYEDEINEEKVQELEEIIDTLIQGYVVQHMFKKKKAIEDFISSI